ncbi:MAG TPA: glycosyltransferase family 39 protein [Ktedonobacterales bacterium]
MRTEELPTRPRRADRALAAPAATRWAARLPGVARVLSVWAPVLALVAVTLALNLWRAGDVSLWYDEGWSYGLASQRPHVMLKYIWGIFQNMALYYFFLHVWLGALSHLRVAPVEWLMRLPSALFVALSAGVVYLFGRRWFNTTAALVGGALYALNGLVLYAGHQARGYGLEMLLVSGGWYALFAALTAGAAARRRWWAAYALLMTMAIYAHLFSLLVFAAQVAALALLLVAPGPWRAKARAELLPMALAVGAVAILVLPIVYAAQHFGGQSTWIPIPTLTDVRAFIVLLAAGTANSALLVLALVLAALAVVAAVAARLRWSAWLPAARLADAWGPRLRALARAPRPGVLPLVCWLALPLALAYFASQPHPNLHLFYPRYLMVVVAPFTLLVGIAVAALRPVAARVALAVLLIGLTLTTLPGWYANMEVQNFRTPAFWLEREYHAGDGLACAPALLCSLPLEYYMEAYPGPAHFDGDSPGWWVWEYYYPPAYNLDAIKRYATAHPRLFFMTLHWAPGTPYTAESQADLDWLRAHYRAVSQIETSTVAIYLFDTTPAAT